MTCWFLGYYAQNAPPFEYNPQNILCGLKTVGYSVKPKIASTDGLVVVSINKKPDDIRYLFVCCVTQLCIPFIRMV